MEIEKLDEGLWRWTGRVEDGATDAVSLYLEVGTTVVLIDPVLPPEDRHRFLNALDRDVARLGTVRIALTREERRARAAELAKRYRATVWCPGDQANLPQGLEIIRTTHSEAVLFWIPAHSTLFTGDELVRVVSTEPS